MDKKSSSRVFNSIKNITYGVANKLLGLVLSLLGRYIFLNILPIEYLGIDGVFSNVLTMLSMADLGFATAMAYSFYKPLAEHDEDKLIRLMTFYRKIYHIIALVVAVIGLMLVPFLDYLINTNHDIQHLTLYYLISLFNTVVSYLFAYKQSIVTADQKYYIISKYSMWIAFAKIIFQTIILYLTHNYTAYLCVGVVTTIAYNLLVNHQANKYYPYICKKSQLEHEDKKNIFENLKAVFIYKISEVLMTGTDNTLISVIVNTAAVGLYGNYLTIINKIVQFANIIFGSMTASIGNMVAKESKEKGYELFKSMRMCSSWMAGYISICMFFLIEGFVKMWLGEEYVMPRLVLVAILCNTFYDIMRKPLLAFREATGLYKKMKYVMLICALCNIVLSIVFGAFLHGGVAGIILASLVSRLCTSFWYEPIVLYKDYFGVSKYKYFRDTIESILLCLFTGVVCRGISDRLIVTGVITWIIKGIVCTVVVNVIYFLYYFRSKEFKNIVRTLVKKSNKQDIFQAL